MTIKEMHVLFRVLGQQMGIQQVRGILPESIDVYLNDVIINKVRSILQENCVVDFKNKVAIQRNEVSPINALRTLYYESDTPKDVLVYLGGYIYNELSGKRYSCRLIDPIELDNTLNDYCNRPSIEYPIMCVNNTLVGDALSFNINVFTGEDLYDDYKLRLKYLIKPNVVKFVGEDSDSNVDCNLPDYLHHEIVELAVQRYFTSLGYTSRPAATNDNN